MARTHINFRTWAALILLGVLIILFFSLGNWQLDRAAQRDAIHARIAQAETLPPIDLTATTPDTDLIPWRPAQARGHWLHRHTVLLENRNYQTRPGYWVATPLQLAPEVDGSAEYDAPASGDESEPAVLVLRGWLARDDITQHTDNGAAILDPALGHTLALPDGERTIHGELLSHVPRLFELWSWSDQDRSLQSEDLTDTRSQLPAFQNLDLTNYARATGLELLPVVLAATHPEAPMIQDWPRPSSDSDTNRGYALQWFSFCLIAAGAWLFIVWRVLKRRLAHPRH